MAWKFWRGAELSGLTNEARDAAIHETLEAVGSEADQEVPLDEGTLLRTKFIKVENGQGMISYGGGPGTGFAKVPYALRWHENSANFQHGRKDRYLADPFNRIAPNAYVEALSRKMREIW